MFKTWKKFVSALLVVALMCPLLSTPVSATNCVNLGNMEIAGIKMTKAEFENAYVTKGLQCVDPADYDKATLTLNNITYSGDSLSMAAIIDDESSVSFNLSGILFNGFKQETLSVNSYVLDTAVDNERVKPLLFEIIIGSGDTNAIVDSSINNASSVKVYFMYNGCAYLFEAALPMSFNQIDCTALNTMTNPEKDLMWFLGVVDPEITVEDTNVPTPYTVKSRTWTGNTYRVTMDINSKKYIQTAIPFGYVEYDDSISTASHIWKCGFFLSVHTTYNGAQVNVDSIIHFSNVSIGVKCGANTAISNILADGRMAKQNGSNYTDTLDLLSCISSNVGTVVTALQFFNNLNAYGTSKEIKFGGSAVNVLGAGTTDASVTTPSGIKLYNNSFDASGIHNTTTGGSGHYMLIDATVRALASTSKSTTGTVYFKWDAVNWSNFDQLASGATASVSFTYSTR